MGSKCRPSSIPPLLCFLPLANWHPGGADRKKRSLPFPGPVRKASPFQSALCLSSKGDNECVRQNCELSAQVEVDANLLHASWNCPTNPER
jgi:hypothetical protein